MISTNDIQRLIRMGGTDRQILSVYLDMSVNSDNKRTHGVFLNKERARFPELDSERDTHFREALGAAFARLDEWMEESFDPANRGVAVFADLGGDTFEAFQFPVALPNRLVVDPHPVVGPLTELVHRYPRFGVIVVDREHLRLLALRMGTVLAEQEVSPAAVPTAHDVQAGGYSQKDYQKRKAEETRQFFRDFADEIEQFHRTVEPDHWILLGTTENTQHFVEYLPKPVADRIIHTDHAPPTLSVPDLRRHIEPILAEAAQQREAATVDVVRDRVRQRHYAVTGLHDTLEQLQEGKVESLLVARGLERDGARCTQCGFYLVRRDGSCPYCGGELESGMDLVESMIRIAADTDVVVEFTADDAMQEMNGVAALLRF